VEKCFAVYSMPAITEDFFKEFSVIILVQGKTMLSLLKVVINNIALLIYTCVDSVCGVRCV
jgi:hypothetical protein